MCVPCRQKKASSGSCPNKRAKLQALSLEASKKAEKRNEQVFKDLLTKISTDIDTYLSNNNTCPSTDYINNIANAIRRY